MNRLSVKRIPSFVWEYLDSATGDEHTKMRNQARLRLVGLTPSVLHGEFAPDLSTTFLGQKLPLPFGISPIGMSGLIWPNAEQLLAKSAASLGIPYTLSTVAAQAPEDLAPHLGENAWFQMYPPQKLDRSQHRQVTPRQWVNQLARLPAKD